MIIKILINGISALENEVYVHGTKSIMILLENPRLKSWVFCHNFLIQIFLKLIGSLGSPCACRVIGQSPCGHT